VELALTQFIFLTTPISTNAPNPDRARGACPVEGLTQFFFEDRKKWGKIEP